jgi:NitT/TauT family transport system ATP-binding protein
MQDWLIEVWEKHKKTVLFITHDIEEAIYLSDRVYVMSSRPGKLTASIKPGFGRPRKREMLYTGEFLTHKKELMSMLKEYHQL